MIKVNVDEYIDRPMISLHKLCQDIGISDVTAWRWSKSGWLKTINIAGRPYLTGRALKEFLARAEAGEFAATHHAPKRARGLNL